MSRYNCPHCQQPTFSVGDKYLAAKWRVLTCTGCNKRACSTPLLLALFYLLYLMDIINFGFLSYMFDSMSWGIAAIVGWVMLDAFSIYLPLAAMRDTGGGNTSNQGTVPFSQTNSPNGAET